MRRIKKKKRKKTRQRLLESSNVVLFTSPSGVLPFALFPPDNRGTIKLRGKKTKIQTENKIKNSREFSQKTLS